MTEGVIDRRRKRRRSRNKQKEQRYLQWMVPVTSQLPRWVVLLSAVLTVPVLLVYSEQLVKFTDGPHCSQLARQSLVVF